MSDGRAIGPRPASVRQARRRRAVMVGTMLLLLAAAGAAWAQSPDPWAGVPGWEVFRDKGCGRCHRVRGVGEGTIGPDLARLPSGTDLFAIGAAMWNHLPRIAKAMREQQVPRPQLKPTEVSNLAAFLFTVQFYDPVGDRARGAGLFVAKGCASCHAVDPAGSGSGPALERFRYLSSPPLLAAAMWNHAPHTVAAADADSTPLRGAEVEDLMGYVHASRAKNGEVAQAAGGSPERGEKLFVAKGCAACHPVDAKKGRPGLRLGTRAHLVSPSEFASLMWNHGTGMWAAMKRRRPALPVLSGQEMADITAYLQYAYYYDPAAGRAARGRRLLADKGCLDCHSIYKRGARLAPDLASGNVVGSPAGQVAALWNHGRFMETRARWHELGGLPALTGQDLADIASYLAGLGSGPPKTSPR